MGPGAAGDLHLPLSIERMVFHWFAPDFDAVPYDAWREENHPVYVEQTYENYQIYGFP
ncbi:hypothetical protein [Nesterenkonia pannonica]|uniref:hypothetical protein n=1 Tax=Nesterenkonia pannonica TaxID=1548602 RepID=UPI0021642343|nr:hypothetical protein [Nesterenkonia pannonica]